MFSIYFIKIRWWYLLIEFLSFFDKPEKRLLIWPVLLRKNEDKMFERHPQKNDDRTDLLTLKSIISLPKWLFDTNQEITENGHFQYFLDFALLDFVLFLIFTRSIWASFRFSFYLFCHNFRSLYFSDCHLDTVFL